MMRQNLTSQDIDNFFNCSPKQIASFLSSEEISIDAQDSSGSTLLAHSINRATDVVSRTRKLLSLGASPNLGDHDGVSPLMLAVDTQSTRNAVNLLLTAGADVHAKSNNGETALGVCINAGGGVEVMTSFFSLVMAGARDKGKSRVNNPPSKYFTNMVDMIVKTNAKFDTRIEMLKLWSVSLDYNSTEKTNTPATQSDHMEDSNSAASSEDVPAARSAAKPK